MTYLIVAILVAPIMVFTVRARCRAIEANKRSPEVRERYRKMILKQK